MQLAAQRPVTSDTKRCAIYTRKSVQPPIPQQLTSLESQRAICASYVSSQQHKGWVSLEKHYDDAGRSGANLDRPALQELLTDIELGLVDVVLVYKLDRITRTLLDFVRLIDFFEKYGVVFVAITQNFDTSDSMGRLIRNILLTFAQFEREITIDRMRDKIRVMKQRGMWAGGEAPLGYDLRRGKLVVNSHEEPAVRLIFETYIVEQRIGAVVRKLAEQGFRRKTWRAKKDGKMHGGTPVSQGSVHLVLNNPIYIGEIRHWNERYPGLHRPIIDRVLWDKAQEVLAERRIHKLVLQSENVLSGLLVDGYGRRMHPRQGTNHFSDYRYYSSRRESWAIRQKIKLVRVNAAHVEQLVIEAIGSLLTNRPELRLLLMRAGTFDHKLERLAAAGTEASVRLRKLSARQLACVLRALLQSIETHTEIVRLVVRVEALPVFLQWDGVGLFALSELELARCRQLHVVDIGASVARECRRHTLPIGQPPEGPPRTPIAGLVSLLGDARLAQRMIFDNRQTPVSVLARSFNRRPLSFSRLVRLNYLAPDIVAAILDGEQPGDLSRKKLMQMDLPIDWSLQRQLLGFPRRADSQLPPLALDR